MKYPVLIALIILLAAPSAMADRRKYAWTYQYAIIAPDNTELEFYQTTKLDKIDSWEYRMEAEHGLSPNWDLSIYQIFSQREGESFVWDAFQVRTRYRLAQPGRFFLDPLLYMEYNRKIDLKRQNKAEIKLVMSRDFDRINIAINPLYEFFWAPGDPVHEFGVDMGLSYEFSYQLSLGMEFVTRYEVLTDKDNEHSLYTGPTISYAPGNVFYTIGYLWGATDDSNDGRIRFLMGVGL